MSKYSGVLNISKVFVRNPGTDVSLLILLAHRMQPNLLSTPQSSDVSQ
jgi:hypothetical protein